MSFRMKSSYNLEKVLPDFDTLVIPSRPQKVVSNVKSIVHECNGSSVSPSTLLSFAFDGMKNVISSIIISGNILEECDLNLVNGLDGTVLSTLTLPCSENIVMEWFGLKNLPLKLVPLQIRFAVINSNKISRINTVEINYST